MEKETVYYWDVRDSELMRRRKKYLRFGYAAIGSIMAVYSAVLLAVVSSLSAERFWLFLSLFLLMFVLLFFSLWFLFIGRSVKDILGGIKLTDRYLDVQGHKFPLSSILYSEVVDFMGSGGLPGVFNPKLNTWMALLVMKRGKKRVQLIREGDTTDIVELSNSIRRLKGLPEQVKIRSYTTTSGFYEWKKEIMKEY